MKRSDETRITPESSSGASARNPGRHFLGRVGRRGSLCLAAAIVTTVSFVLLYGCSNQSGQSTSARAVPAKSSPVAAQSAAYTPPSAAQSGTPAAHIDAGSDPAASASADAVPPEISVSVEDTLVVPGDVVAITAQTSSDVSEVLLRDRVGRTQAFTRDSSSGEWRTYYRMPMRMPGERLGLSVTARNGVERWRRVWVFLRPAEPEGEGAED